MPEDYGAFNYWWQRWEKRVQDQLVGLEQTESIALRKERTKLKLKKVKGVKQIELTHVQCLPDSELVVPEGHERWISLCIEGKQTDAIALFAEKIGFNRLFNHRDALEIEGSSHKSVVSYPAFLCLLQKMRVNSCLHKILSSD